MPRGFLVKRSKKGCGVYRVPCDTSPQQQPLSFPPASAHIPNSAPDSLPTVKERAKVVESHCKVSSDASPVRLNETQPLYSPALPTGIEMKTMLFKRYCPASGEFFLVAASLASMEKLLINSRPFMTPGGKLQGNRDRPRFAKCPSKRSKVLRKLNFTDQDVSASPVLGMKIKAEEGPEFKSRSPMAIICQLCKEQYPDTFALAQHKCSRTVRVEYRCPECAKVFSCPANLASHRRWHKPRAAAGSEGHGGKKLPSSLQGKENSSAASSVPLSLLDAPPVEQHQQAADSSQLSDQHQRNEDSSSMHNRAATEAPVATQDEKEEDEASHCPCCHKRFRRAAYLRKHPLSPRPCSPTHVITYPCALCGLHLPPIHTMDTHHRLTQPLLLPIQDSGGDRAGSKADLPL